ncbi:hypothetical protein RI129_007179 [Pyrocoelia pectoralis]|uniref:4-coumarate--CoA ligase n=1 Tax=Pyrocoelia pectoralis TaxID=417401 RepID=A0AAN7VG35_9COLE
MIFMLRNLVKLCPKSWFILNKNVHSVIPNLVIPTISLEECIWKNIEKWHSRTALICAETNRRYTYLEVYNKTNSLAHFLYNFDKLNKSDTIASILPNLPENAIIYLGAIEAGFKISCINPSLTPDEMGRQLIQADTKMVFTTSEAYKNVFHATQLSKLQIPIIVLKVKEETQLPNETIDFNDTLRHVHKVRLNLRKNHEDTIMILFSSGTTGYPKAVEITNKNVVSNLLQLSTLDFNAFVPADEFHQEVVPIVAPMYHVLGIMVLLLKGLLNGCKLVTIPKFTLKLFLNTLEQHKASVLYGAPPIIHLLLSNEHVKQSHLASLKTIVSGAAPLKAVDVTKLLDKLNGRVNVLQGYGLTEITAVSHLQTPSIENGIKPGGIGLLVPGTEAKILSPDGEELGANKTGELILRGPQVVKGYYNNEQATKESFSSDGWFKTGDLGHYDEDDHFFITDRIKDLIKVKGYQVAPGELEELMRHHPDIADVAVIGVSHDKFGEVPKAFVVPKHDSKITSTDIQEYVNNRVVNYKRLVGGVVFIESVPKSPAGKILKKELKHL